MTLNGNNIRNDTTNDHKTLKTTCVPNSNVVTESQLELTVEDIVRDRTILDRLEIIPNPFESQQNTRINYPSFEEMFFSNKMPTISPYPASSKNSSNCSGSFNRSNNNDSSTHFRWSIDQIARLLPADIEYKLQDDTLTIFKPQDDETQHKIDEYFRNTTLPSPYTPDSRKISPISFISKMDEFHMEPSPTDLYISHGTNGKFFYNKNMYNNIAESTNLNQNTSSDFISGHNLSDCKNSNKYIKMSCQTDISIHPDIDISKFLGDMFILHQENCHVLNSNAKVCEQSDCHSKIKSENTPNTSYYETTPIHSNTSNMNSVLKNNFYDTKYIQNSTANDLIDVFKQLEVSNNESTTQERNTSKRKNLHVKFKDEDNDNNTFTEDICLNTLPNPLTNINTQNIEINESYCIKTRPYDDPTFECLSHNAPYTYNNNKPTGIQNSNSVINKHGDMHSSWIYEENKINTGIKFDSNLSSPSWNDNTSLNHTTTYFNQIPQNVTVPKNGSPHAHFDKLDKCFGYLDTSPIKPYYVFNSTTTDLNLHEESIYNLGHTTTDDRFNEKHNSLSNKSKDSKSSRNTSITESGYSSNATSVTTFSLASAKNIHTTVTEHYDNNQSQPNNNEIT